jgi:hypothetical protein
MENLELAARGESLAALEGKGPATTSCLFSGLLLSASRVLLTRFCHPAVQGAENWQSAAQNCPLTVPDELYLPSAFSCR